MPAFAHVDLALSTGLNDGTTWANAYQGSAGLVTAIGAAAGGEVVYGKNVSSDASLRVFAGPTTLATATNPVRVIGVRSDTAREGASIIQADLIPGIRTGNATRAYLQTGGNAPPHVTVTGSPDITINGNVIYYGFIFTSNDNINIAAAVAGLSFIHFEECKLEVTGVGDFIIIGNGHNSNFASRINMTHGLIALDGGKLLISNTLTGEWIDVDIDSTATPSIDTTQFGGRLKLLGSDLSGCSASGIFGIGGINDGVIECWNCDMPLNHVLTTGTAAQLYTVANYGSDDNTGLDSADSEQALEIHTHEGTVDIETIAVRTGGADDEATDSGGPFSWAIIPNNVTDNIVGVISPWMEKWVLGDGTAKTLTVFFANGAAESAANLLEDDEIYLEVQFPDEAGTSMYQTLPDQGAPGDGGGLMQLLGTAADIATDGSTWGSGANNKQKFTQAIAPDYRGLVRARTIYSKASGPTLFQDPAMTVT